VLAAGAGAAVALAWPDGDPGPPGGAAGTQASPTPGADPPADTSTESSGEDASEGDSSEDVGDDTAQRTGGPIDECLVGRWEQTSMTDAWNLLGQRVDVSGWDGRVVVFDASGRETVEYDDADPVTGTTAAGTLVDTYQGTAHYNVSTDGGTLRFEDVDNSGVSVDRELAGMTESYTPPSVAAADVAYECDGATHVQRSVGGSYEARFERVGTGR